MCRISSRVLRTPNEEERIFKNLLEISWFITDNYDEIRAETDKIIKDLSVVKGYAVAYSNENFALSHAMIDIVKTNSKMLLTIVENVESIQKGLGKELFQGINFFDIMGDLAKKHNISEIIIFCQESQDVLRNIAFEFSRIKKMPYPNKKVAILRGMLALS